MCETDPTIWDGIVIGGIGGALAGATVLLIGYIHLLTVRCCHKRRVYKWLRSNVEPGDGTEHRTTRAIASHNNLTEDRVRFICSHHKKIYLSTGKKKDIWGLHGVGRSKLKSPWWQICARSVSPDTTEGGRIKVEPRSNSNQNPLENADKGIDEAKNEEQQSGPESS